MRILSGSFGGRTVRTVEGPGYRPATAKVRGAIFSMLEARGVVWAGVRVLDLFAGSGSLGFEALSRGALEASFVEKAPNAVACMRKTMDDLHLQPPQCQIFQQDVATFIRQRPWQPFDVIFIDPPYGLGRLDVTLKAVVKGGWLAAEGFLLAEAEKHLKPELTQIDLPGLELEVDRTYGQTRIGIWQHHPLV